MIWYGMYPYEIDLKTHFIRIHSRIVIIQTVVLSVINLGFKIWGNTNCSLIQRAQKLQNFSAKVVVEGYKRRDGVIPVLQELRGLKIKEKLNLINVIRFIM